MRIDQFEIFIIFGIIIELIYQKYFLAIILLIFGVLLLFRNYAVARDFKCKRCGKCCKLRVEPNEKDTKRIKESGKRDFMQGRFLKRIGEDKRCIFLKYKKELPDAAFIKTGLKYAENGQIQKGIFGKQVDPRCNQFIKIK